MLFEFVHANDYFLRLTWSHLTEVSHFHPKKILMKTETQSTKFCFVFTYNESYALDHVLNLHSMRHFHLSIVYLSVLLLEQEDATHCLLDYLLQPIDYVRNEDKKLLMSKIQVPNYFVCLLSVNFQGGLVKVANFHDLIEIEDREAFQLLNWNDSKLI